MSRNDKKFIRKMTEGIRVIDGQHFEMPLPFKDSKPSLSNNTGMAKRRLGLLRKRFQRDPRYKDDYMVFIYIFDRGYAEKVLPADQKKRRFKGQCGTFRTTECIIPKSLDRYESFLIAALNIRAFA